MPKPGSPLDGPTSDSNDAVLVGFDDAFDAFVVALRRARAGTIEREGLSLSQYELLRALASGDGLPVGRLAELAGVAAPSATQMLDGLERMGLVERTRSSTDRRAVTVSLTGEGRRCVDEKRRQIATRRRRLFESLAPEERRQAERLLHHLAELIAEL